MDTRDSARRYPAAIPDGGAGEEARIVGGGNWS